MTITAHGESLRSYAATTLIHAAPRERVRGGADTAGLSRQYDVTRDGRFLINTVLDDAAATPVTLIQNWRPEEKQ